jgi:xylulokinase
MEGVALALRDSLDLIGELGERPSLARASGGGARSELWLRIVASTLELPLERVAVDAGAAFGAALLGGVAGGVWPDVHAAVAATVRPRDRIDPVPEWVAVYRERRKRFRKLYPALREN